MINYGKFSDETGDRSKSPDIHISSMFPAALSAKSATISIHTPLFLHKRNLADNIGIDCSRDEGQADATAFFNAVFVDGGDKRLIDLVVFTSIEQRFKLDNQSWNVFLNRIPHNFVIKRIITMCDDIPESYDRLPIIKRVQQ